MATIERTYSEYDRLLAEAIRLRKRHESHAKDFVPKMYTMLVEREGLASHDAADRIYKDLVGIWEKDTIRRLLPVDAKDQSARLRQALSRMHMVAGRSGRKEGDTGILLQNEQGSGKKDGKNNNDGNNNDNTSRMVITELEQRNASLRKAVETLQEDRKLLLEKTLKLELMLAQRSNNNNSGNVTRGK